MNDLLRIYRQARAIYSEADFAEFFKRAGIKKPIQQSIGKDILVGAAMSYLLEWGHQETRLSQATILSGIASARSAAKDLSRTLEKLFEAGGISSDLSEIAQSERASIIEKYGVDSDTFKVASSIFALDDAHQSFRISGLLGTIDLIDDLLGKIQHEGRERTRKNRLEPMRHMAAPVIFYWLLIFGKLPTVGHYDKDVAERSSGAVAALTYVAQRIDPKISERLVVDAVLSLNAALQSSDGAAQAECSALIGLALMFVIFAGEAYSPKDYIRRYLEAPTGWNSINPEDFNKAWGSLQTAESGREFALITKAAFSETVSSALLKIKSYQAEVEPATE